MFCFKENLSVKLCKANPNATIVFGDNLIGKGQKGQAIIRYCSNSFGVPTKRLPSMMPNAFFSDTKEEYNLVRSKLIVLWKKHLRGEQIILPLQPIGSGLAKLQENSPKIYKMIETFYQEAHKTNL